MATGRSCSWPLVALLALGLLSQFSEGTREVRCELDDDQSNEQFDRCIQEGEKLVKKMVDRDNKGNTRRRKSIDVCRHVDAFTECFKPIKEGCPHLLNQHMLKHWSIIYDQVNCSCSGIKSCRNSLNCFTDQMQGKLGKQCDAFYKFNLKQETQNRCHFLYENIHCKVALVESACSPESGVLAFHVGKIANKLHKRHGCVINYDRNYDGFRYTDKCPANLTNVVYTCEKRFLDNKLLFREDFDLIPSGGRKNIREQCQSYTSYRECVSNIEENCLHGLKKVYGFDGMLRSYLVKMDFICNEGKKGFNQHVRCYRGVLQNNTLSRCNHIWTNLSPNLERINAHNFYCLNASNDTRDLRGSLADLRQCYENVFTESCPGGGVVVAQLMEKVFEDPLYLRYRYRPDCRLHAGPPLATGMPPTSAPHTATRGTNKAGVAPRTENPEVRKGTVLANTNAAPFAQLSPSCLSLLVFTLALGTAHAWR